METIWNAMVHVVLGRPAKASQPRLVVPHPALVNTHEGCSLCNGAPSQCFHQLLIGRFALAH